jgi:RNA polymerase sigma factor (sigma-70 family)
VNATLARLTRLTAGPQPAGDGTLLDAFLAGDQEAFAVLVRRHAGLVFATCRRVLRHQQDAEDAHQATFLVLARRAADVWPREAVASWLFGVAHRVALKARAARNRRLTREQPLQEVAGEERTRPDLDTAELVHRIVGKLPEVYRAAVVACDLEGLSRKEAAERLGWSEGTLSGRLARARELLANRLRRHGLSLPAGGLAALAATERASADMLQATIELATGAAASAPPAIVALTEGVVRSMGLLQLKAMAAAVLAACALGWGAFAASGAGAGDGSGQQTQSQTRGDPPPPVVAQPTDPPSEPPPAPRPMIIPRIGLARRELGLLLQEIERASADKKANKDVMERFLARLRIVDQLLEPYDRPHEEKPPAKPASDLDRLKGAWRVVGLSEGGKAIPFDRLKGPVDFGVAPRLSPQDGKATLVNLTEPVSFFFGDDTLQMPFLEEGKVWKRRAFSFVIDEKKTPREITLFAANRPVGRGIYEFTPPAKTCQSCHEAPNNPALGGGPEAAFSKWFGLCAPGANAFPLGVRLAFSINGNRPPEKFDGPGVIRFDLARPARAASPRERLDRQGEELRGSQLALEKAQAEAAEARVRLKNAQARVRVADARLEEAKSLLKVAERNAAKPVPATEGNIIAVHVRLLTAAEKVIPVKATGHETVLEGLAHAAEDMAIKSEAVSVWVVRDKTILPVDVAGIRKGETKTNYVLMAGDRLFVQAKPNP